MSAASRRGSRVTPRPEFIDRLRAQDGAEVVEGVRFVRDDDDLIDRGRREIGNRQVALAGRAALRCGVVSRTKDSIAYDPPAAERAEAR